MPMSGHHAMKKFERSFLNLPRAKRVADVQDDARVRLTVVLKPAEPIHPGDYAGGRGVNRAEFTQRHATSESIIDAVVRFAQAHGLEVEAIQPERHRVKLVGTYAQACAAF